MQSLAAAVTANPKFALAMGCAILLAAIIREVRLAATTAVLCGNWLLGVAFLAQVFDPAHPWAPLPWTWYLAIDYLAGFCLLGVFRPSKGQALVGLIYAMMLVRHVAYGYSDQAPRTTYDYDWQLTWAATAQFLVVNGWGLHELYNRRRIARSLGRSASFDPAGSATVARKGA